MAVSPITPWDIATTKVKVLPDEVISAFNELIAANYTSGIADVDQNKAIDLILHKIAVREGVPFNSDFMREWRPRIFSEGWLNIEEVFRAAGWTVVYDKPGYNETYPAIFAFRKQNRRRL